MPVLRAEFVDLSCGGLLFAERPSTMESMLQDRLAAPCSRVLDRQGELRGCGDKGRAVRPVSAEPFQPTFVPPT